MIRKDIPIFLRIHRKNVNPHGEAREIFNNKSTQSGMARPRAPGGPLLGADAATARPAAVANASSSSTNKLLTSGLSQESLEKAINARFESELSALKLFETPEGNRTRAAAVKQLESVLLGAITHIGVSKGMSEADAAKSGARLMPFGSYREGVHGPSGDIDLLAVVPSFVDRTEFFSLLPILLTGACPRPNGRPMRSAISRRNV